MAVISRHLAVLKFEHIPISQPEQAPQKTNQKYQHHKSHAPHDLYVEISLPTLSPNLLELLHDVGVVLLKV